MRYVGNHITYAPGLHERPIMPLTKFQKCTTWLKQYWYIPLFVLGMVLGWLLSGNRRQRGTPLAQTRRELLAIEAAQRAQNKVVEVGALRAKEWVEANYQSEIRALNMVQRSEASELSRNPAKLAAYLVRAAGNR